MASATSQLLHQHQGGVTNYTNPSIADCEAKRISDARSSHITMGSTTSKDSTESVEPMVDPLSGMHRLSPEQEDILIEKGIILTKTNERKATLFSSVVNLSKTAMGTGFLSLAYSVANSGFIMGFALFCFFAVLTMLSLNLLMISSRLKLNASFYSMGKQLLPKWTKLIDLSLIINCFGCAVANLIIIGDLMPPASENLISLFRNNGDNNDSNIINLFLSRRFWITFFSIFFILPIIRIKRMDSFKMTSMIALLCLGYIGLVSVVYLFTHVFSQDNSFDGIKNAIANSNSFPTNGLLFAKVFSIYVYGFACHQNGVVITRELVKPTLKRIHSVTFWSMLLCVCIYVTIGFAGYFTFGLNSESDILLNYPNDTWYITLVRISLSIALAWSFPLNCDPVRKSVVSMIYGKDIDEVSNKMFYFVTYMTWAIAFVISMFVQSLGLIFGVGGSTAATALSYIWPALFYYYSYKNIKHDVNIFTALFLLVFGIAVFIFGTVAQFI